MPDDLHALLVSSLTARLERARAATPGPWAIWRDLDHQGFFTVGDEAGIIPEGQQMTEGECNPTAHVYVEPDAAFIAANDPAAEIRRVEALLRVVERHAPEVVTYAGGVVNTECRECEAVWPCPTIRDLASGEGIEVET